jgi:hypothetical protein
MTICVAVSVFDGIVFAADSATSIVSVGPNNQTIISNVYRNANKVFNLYRGRPLVAMTCGMGNLGRAPISVLAKNLRRQLMGDDVNLRIDPDNFTMEEVAQKSWDFFKGHYDLIQPPLPNDHSFEFTIGGFSSNAHVQEIWKITFANGVCQPVIRHDEPGWVGLLWSGQPEAINRLIMGFSPLLCKAFVNSGMAEPVAQQLLAQAGPLIKADIVNASMPLQDAIELAQFLVETTKRFVRFLPGADTVGGAVDIATVTPHERFKWIKRKHYYTSELNVLETDHG